MPEGWQSKALHLQNTKKYSASNSSKCPLETAENHSANRFPSSFIKCLALSPRSKALFDEEQRRLPKFVPRENAAGWGGGGVAFPRNRSGAQLPLQARTPECQTKRRRRRSWASPAEPPGRRAASPLIRRDSQPALKSPGYGFYKGAHLQSLSRQ